VISRASIENLADGITTVGQARAVLGAEAEQLKVGYDLIDQIGRSSGILHDYTPFGTVMDAASADARTAAQDVLDQANAYAQGIYSTLPKEADSWELDESWRKRVSTALLTGFSAVQAVQNSVNELRPNYTEEYLSALQSSVSGLAGAVTSVVKSVVSGIGFWPIFIAVSIVLVVVYVASRARATVGA
jgi:hypothetical protein